ncbi:MAG TPA: sugar ABC transporter permease [Acidisoma sp.]|uniref:carbohydrate ABC transporter permease n=1 Tax=Acidisoma sp. TaxID=1872115 RepID=UPI002B60F161|nr:sugar ABC transporter permease [Acidisoma sp.]HTH99848.1 sugar ABC transporter permease [Acidisoma sp.]
MDRTAAAVREAPPFAEPRAGMRGSTGQRRPIGPVLCTAPSVTLLLLWMIVPLGMTIWFSLLRYNLMDEGRSFIGAMNYVYLLTDPALTTALINTLVLVLGVLAATVVFGMLIALLVNQPMHGRAGVRLLVIAPFFVMPTVSALIWKNMLMNPVSGLIAWLCHQFGLPAFDWFAQAPLLAVGIIVAWQWIPFATLILLTALQSLDQEQIEAAQLDGAGAVTLFRRVVAPHLARPVTIVILIETMFLLSVFAEILVTTGGGPGNDTTNLPYLIYKTALLDYDIGGASAGGLIAVVLANIVAIFLVRTVARSLDQ